MIRQVNFGGSVTLTLVPDFRDCLTFGNLINKLIYIMNISINEVLTYKHFKGYFDVL